MVAGVFGLSGPWEWGLVLVLVLILFGVGKLPKVLGQMGKGVKAFKDGMKTGEEEELARALDAAEAAEIDEAELGSTVSEAEEVHV
jgi:sec-independent protein translocase protein TatA